MTSEDFDVIPKEEDPTDIAVTVATDVPVHTSLIGYPARQMMVTPFIQLMDALGEDAHELMPVMSQLAYVRQRALPYVKRAGSCLLRADLPGVKAALLDSPDVDDAAALDEVDPVDLLRVAFDEVYEPLEDASLSSEAHVELIEILEKARGADRARLAQLLAAFEAGPLPEHRHRVFDTAITALEDVQALTPALWAEQMDGVLTLDDYRVMRDDFDPLKARYQDVFELGSRSLAFMAQAANIAVRGDARAHADGKRRSLSDAIHRTRAVDREPWLVDFPKARELYDAIKRHTRNDIGHRLVRYDAERGSLVFDDGAVENCLLFLVDYLHALRLTHYLVDVVLALWQARSGATIFDDQRWRYGVSGSVGHH